MSIFGYRNNETLPLNDLDVHVMP